MLMKFVFESASGEALQSCLKGFASQTSQELRFYSDQTAFSCLPEVQKSEVYSDLEKRNPIFQNDRSTCGGFFCALKIVCWGEFQKENQCLFEMPVCKTLKNWVICILNLCNTAKRYCPSRLPIIYMHKLKDNVFLDLYRWYNNLALHIWEKK